MEIKDVYEVSWAMDGRPMMFHLNTWEQVQEVERNLAAKGAGPVSVKRVRFRLSA